MKQKLNSIIYTKKNILFFVLLLVTITGLNCSVLQTITNLSRLQFKISSTSNVQLAGVSLEGKRSTGDFSSTEVLKLSTAFVRNSLPLTFTINVDAKNPNDGTGGYPHTNATIVSFPWRLFIDDKQTVTGNIGPDVTVPGTGEATVIPLQVSVDLVQFFKDKGYEGIVNLALNLAGQGTSASKITLYAQPTVSTDLGNIKYPNELKIVNFEYTK
ncbi:MAG: hypothetical protein WB779_01095 [Ignavibacteriaceae bacterium]